MTLRPGLELDRKLTVHDVVKGGCQKNGLFTVRLTVRVDTPPHGQGVMTF